MDIERLLGRLPAPVTDRLLDTAAGRGWSGRILNRFLGLRGHASVPALPPRSDAAVRIAIGPANTVEQAYLWCRAWEFSDPEASALSIMIDGSPRLRTDIRVPRAIAAGDRDWQRSLEALLSERTHVIQESGRAFLGGLHDADPFRELAHLRRSGVAVGVLFHGSDIRDPAAHLQREKHSPFADPGVPTVLLRRKALRNRRRARDLGAPVFVTTPDLLLDVPEAHWCPVTIDVERWASPGRSGESARVIVAHAPSNGVLKGSDLIDPVLGRLDAEGLITYRRVEGVAPEAMPAVYADADIVVDQVRMGLYGAASAEAMAAGAVAVAHVSEQVREVVRERSGRELPVVQAVPEDLEDVIRRLAADAALRGDLRRRGSEFVTAVHSGPFSVRTLADALDGTAPVTKN